MCGLTPFATVSTLISLVVLSAGFASLSRDDRVVTMATLVKATLVTDRQLAGLQGAAKSAR